MEKTKEKRIKEEVARLSKLLEDVPESKKKLAAGLIEREAFLRVECEDLEQYLAANGWAEAFRQSEKVEPYDRARPQGQTYATLIGNYQKIIKQLCDLKPDKVSDADELAEFLK